jgi:leader peptidase (prepilin peptidase) / N-methyltransferase
VAAAIAWRFGVSVQTAAALLLFFWLVPLAMIDADTSLLPNSCTLPLLWAGLGFNLFAVFVPLPEAVTGAIAGYLFLAIPSWIYEWLKKVPEAMGRGDFTLMALFGAWFGWSAILPIVLLSSCVALAVCLPLMLAGKRDLLSKIPFGPYIAGAGMIYLFFGAALKEVISLPL